VDAALAGSPRDAGACGKPLGHSATKGLGDEWRARDGSFEEGLAEFGEQHSFLTRSKIVVGAVALVLLVSGLMLFHPWSGSGAPPKSPSYETPAGATTTPSEPALNIPQPPPTQPTPDAPTKSQPPLANSSVLNKPPVERSTKDKGKVKNAVDTPIQGFEGNSTFDGMTQKDIPRLLEWARSDAGNGNYTKAAQEYRVILQLQPNNSEAREGLRKIQVAQGRDQ